MDRINEVTRHCLDALIALRHSPDGRLPPAETMRQQMASLVDDLLERAAQQGFVQSDCQEIAYAVVALADEIAMAKPEGFRQGWLRQLLQLQYFNENTAGEGFFKRLQALRADPQRAEVLRVYHLCLLLGFQGRYRFRGGELELVRLIDELGRTVGAPELLSPHLARASGTTRDPRRGPLLMASAMVLAASLLFYAGLRLVLSSQSSAVAEAFTAAVKR